MIQDESSEGSPNVLFNQLSLIFRTRETGRWPKTYKEPNECKTIATAVLSALDNAGYKFRSMQAEASPEAGVSDLREGAKIRRNFLLRIETVSRFGQHVREAASIDPLFSPKFARPQGRRREEEISRAHMPGKPEDCMRRRGKHYRRLHNPPNNCANSGGQSHGASPPECHSHGWL